MRKHSIVCVQAVGPVALVSLLLNEGLTKVIPGAEANSNPNRPADPAVQQQYNHAAIQVCDSSFIDSANASLPSRTGMYGPE